MNKTLLFTCEHGGHRIPAAYRALFSGRDSVLASHRGWDPGALDMAKQLATTFAAPLLYSETSRLLVDLNRSPHHRQFFSEFTRCCESMTRQQIMKDHYLPYRRRVSETIDSMLESHDRVIHFSIHSFTPRLNNSERRTDIGLLYDPARAGEQRLCMAMQKHISNTSANWLVRRNYPYRGAADGLTTALRERYTNRRYSGIEIELNQKHVGNRKNWRLLYGLLANAIRHIS